MKVIHISDLHYPKTGDKTELLVEGIINHYTNIDLKPIIIITGDILDTPSANDNNYKEAKEVLLRLKTAGFKILLTVGNHDVKKDGIKKRRFIDVYKKKYNSYFQDLLCEGHNHLNNTNDLLTFPIVHRFNNYFFLGLDSMSKQRKYAKAARGLIGNNQLSTLKSHLKEIKANNPLAKIIIYLHHNPMEYFIISQLHTWGTKLKDRAQLISAINGVDALFFGHIHYNKRYSKQENKHAIRIIQLSGGSTHGDTVDWIEVDLENFETSQIELDD